MKKALCVGINDYPFEGNDLNGCVNDANAWAALLIEGFGFEPDHVRLLLDGEATKANILTALDELLDGAEAGDVLVFTNSSHGSYVADTDGDEEVYDEILCPWDVAENHILDDELRGIFSGLAEGVRLTVILDNCFSGTATRAISLIPTPDDRRRRFLSPAVRGLPVIEDLSTAKKRSSPVHPESEMREVLLTGCTDQEYSYDANIDGVYCGAMSSCAQGAIREANYEITYRQLHQRIQERMAYPQHPQLEGNDENLDRQIFS